MKRALSELRKSNMAWPELKFLRFYTWLVKNLAIGSVQSVDVVVIVVYI